MIFLDKIVKNKRIAVKRLKYTNKNFNIVHVLATKPRVKS